MAESLFRPGENCTEVAHARRVAFIVDAEDYFRVFMQACERAERDILILGWDFDSRTVMNHAQGGKPVLLGEFLDGLARRKRGLQIRILDWDYPMVFGTDRETPPTLGLTWKPHHRVDFRFDDTHPVAGSHHQKIVVIDDRLAFSGGLDLTNKRWDTREHKVEDPRRVFEGEPYPPFHDVMIAVDGPAARALGRTARSRWLAASGGDPWPAELAVDVTDVDAAISRTLPATEESAGVREVEALFLEMIARAQRCIYIENQYFTSHVIGDALAKRLAEPEGPEIVVVTRLLSHGWLEEITMTTLRSKLVKSLRKADKHGHFHCFYPDVPGLCEGTCLDIHSKVMVVDDEWLRIGSSNLSNRSMGLDSECDVTIEAKGEGRIADAIRAFRDCLIGEHVGAAAEEVARRVERAGSVAAAIMSMGSATRSLLKLEAPEPTGTEIVVAKVGDPGAPPFEAIVPREAPPAARNARGFTARRVLFAVGGLIAAAAALALVWTHSPLKDVVSRDNAAALSEWFAGHWWAPIVVLLAYTPASFIMFPRWLITMTAVLAFGPWSGFFIAQAGVILAGIVTFIPGRLVDRETVRRLAGKSLRRVALFMERKGLVAVALVRLVPIAPFPVVNIVMGAMRVKLWHFVLGTFIGMLPGMLATTVLSEQLGAALEDSTQVNFWLVAAAVIGLATIAFFGQRYVRRHSAH